jgi:hypothetical protein
VAVIVVIAIVVAASFLFMTPRVEAADLPTYAQGDNINTKVDSKGRDITNVVVAVAVIIGIIGLFVAAGFFGAGQSDTGRRVLISSIIGLILTALAYAIAAVAIK